MRPLLLVSILSGMCSLGVGQTGIKPVRVTLDGHEMNFDRAGAREAHGRILVPLRKIVERMGAQVTWRRGGQVVYVSKGPNSIQLTIGEPSAFVNGRQTTLETAPEIENGRTLVPLRLVSEALGATVAWNSNTEVATIITPGGAHPTPKTGY